MEQGKCPKCNSENLIYDTFVYHAATIYYPFTCDDCGRSGKEWYNVVYIESELD